MAKNKVFLKVTLGILIIALFMSIIGVNGQTNPTGASQSSTALACTTCEVIRGLGNILTKTTSIDKTMDQLLDQLKILNHQKTGQIVTGSVVLLQDVSAGYARTLWADMPKGTCDVVLNIASNPQATQIQLEEAKIDMSTRNAQSCIFPAGSFNMECYKIVQFDDEYNFLHFKPYPLGSFSFLQLVYKCVLS